MNQISGRIPEPITNPYNSNKTGHHLESSSTGKREPQNARMWKREVISIQKEDSKMNPRTVIKDYNVLIDLMGSRAFSADYTLDPEGIVNLDVDGEATLKAIQDGDFHPHTPEDEPVQVSMAEKFVVVRSITPDFQTDAQLIALKDISPEDSLQPLREVPLEANPKPIPVPPLIQLDSDGNEELLELIETIALASQKKNFRHDDPPAPQCPITTYVEGYLGESENVTIFFASHRNSSGLTIRSVFSQSRAPECQSTTTEFHGVESTYYLVD